ncbi:MAG: ring-cleaving dioxygenase [Flavobacterium sp.]|nr:ring-cleaving dioxygenase [Flavobacterium sp.]
MEHKILGLHHITAISKSAKRNFDFYTKVLGLRMVKKTVNFDDPGTYHFYYGNEQGSPGTILTFFPWEGIGSGRKGAGQTTEIDYSVPDGSLDFWIERFKEHKVNFGEKAERFGETYLPFTDPDGLSINLVIPQKKDERIPWEINGLTKEHAVKGYNSVTLLLKKIDATAKLLTDIFGYRLLSQEGNRYRFQTDAVENASTIDLVEDANAQNGYSAAGTNHHIAFRVANETAQMEFREKIQTDNSGITPKINRDYFYSVYFREPGGVLFEIATDNPGFTVDEPLAELGTHLKLPSQYEPAREKIEKQLPSLE